MIEVFWKKGEREIGEKNWNNKLKCRNPKILTDSKLFNFQYSMNLSSLGLQACVKY